MDIYEGADWTEMDIDDLKAAIERPRTVESIGTNGRPIAWGRQREFCPKFGPSTGAGGAGAVRARFSTR
jgi:hypothetical protein